MGLGTNIVVFTIILSWTMWLLLGYAPLLVNLVSCFQNPLNPIVQTNSTGAIVQSGGTTPACPINITFLGVTYNITFYLVITGLFGVGVWIITGSLASGTIFYPDPYKLFGGVAIFLFGLVTFPVDLIMSNQAHMPIPYPIQIMLAGVFMMSYTIAFLLFFRTGGGSTW
jgi:hypothetical protein